MKHAQKLARAPGAGAAGSLTGAFTYGKGTMLSQAYTKGKDGLPCPRNYSRGSASYRAWAQGRAEAKPKCKVPACKANTGNAAARSRPRRETSQLVCGGCGHFRTIHGPRGCTARGCSCELKGVQ